VPRLADGIFLERFRPPSQLASSLNGPPRRVVEVPGYHEGARAAVYLVLVRLPVAALLSKVGVTVESAQPLNQPFRLRLDCRGGLVLGLLEQEG
jgi:hypothetical protein